MCLTSVVIWSPISTPSRAPGAAQTTTGRTHSCHNTTISQNAAATQRRPPRPATCQTYTLTCPTPHSHDNYFNRSATRASERYPSRNNANANNKRRATRQTLDKQLSSNARERTSCVQADARQSRPTHATTTRSRRGHRRPHRAEPTPNPSRQSSNHQIQIPQQAPQ